MKKVYIGTSGYNYKHWKEIFYPEDVPAKKWLEYYSQNFNTVEINATFYGHFKREVFEGWAQKTPKDFVFTLKGPRYITHIKKITDAEESLNYFFNSAFGLGKKLSLVLWQFPPSFKLTEETINRFEAFLSLLPKEVKHAVEFRHKTWFEDKVFKLMDKDGIGFVINDSGRFPEHETITGKLAYVRFHGPTRLYASKYTKEQLKAWANKIKGYAKQREVYCYFNNDNFGYAIEDSKYLIKLLT